mmetsp:Transcript_120988/g.210467  ORF Transcript_120988/g.210467 Transcript_120988/m.210467 type:complete len:107 (-) Transcript_120988:150-470(-)
MSLRRPTAQTPIELPDPELSVTATIPEEQQGVPKEEAADIEDVEDVHEDDGEDVLSGEDTANEPIATDGVAAAPGAATPNKDPTTVAINTAFLPHAPFCVSCNGRM